MADGLVEQGWFVTSDHAVFAIMNGRPYEVDAEDTPLPKLPPGSYTNDEVSALLAPAKASPLIIRQRMDVERERSLRWIGKREFDESKHPRNPKGEFTSGGGGGGNGAAEAKPTSAAAESALRDFADNWANGGGWGDYQHAASAVISGLKRDDYVCYDCSGDDGDRYDTAKEILDAVEQSPVDKTLYRGLFTKAQYEVGDKFSESLTSWTGDENLAAEFASGHYAAPWEKTGKEKPTVLALMQSDNMKGIDISSRLPADSSETLKNADEWLTSGQYEVVRVNDRADGPREVFVRRVGRAKDGDLKKAFDESKHPRDETGKFTSGGGDLASPSTAPAKPVNTRPAIFPTPNVMPAPSRPEPTIKYSDDVNRVTAERVQKAIGGIPANHANDIKDVPIAVVPTTAQIRRPNAIGLFSPHTLTIPEKLGPNIQLAERELVRDPENPGTWNFNTGEWEGANYIEVEFDDIGLTAVHEAAHALDYSRGKDYTGPYSPTKAAERWGISNSKEFWERANVGIHRLEGAEASNAQYYTSDKQEMFAELYALAYGPHVARYFGSLSKDQAEYVFAEALEYVKAINGAKAFNAIVLRQLMELQRDRAKRLIMRAEPAKKAYWHERYYGEKPGERDEAGKFGPGGGSGTSSTEPSKEPARSEVRAGRKASEGGLAKAKAGVDAIPAAHAQLLKHVPVTVSRTLRDIPRENAKDNEAIMGCYMKSTKEIMIAEMAPRPSLFGGFGGVGIDLDVQGSTIHELGHAYDYHFNNKPSHSLLLQRGNNRSPLWLGYDRMTDDEKTDAQFTISSTECFAELYNLAYNAPSSQAKYFGNMTRDRAMRVFPEALAKVKAFANATDAKTVDKATKVGL